MSERPNVNVGDERSARSGEIIRVLVGSGVHGMAIEGLDDRDEMGVYLQSEREVLGLAASKGHWISRTQPEGVRSGPGDIDLSMYSLHKYLRLAVAGNPTVLILLFATGDAVVTMSPLGVELQSLAPSIVSVEAGRRFLGYLDGQHRRMDGYGHVARMPKRPELVERFGYDTKYASHALRLGYQGVELMTTGRLTLPLPEPALSACRAVKQGHVDAAGARVLIEDVRDQLFGLLTSGGGVLPERPDADAVSDWMISAQRRFWAEQA